HFARCRSPTGPRWFPFSGHCERHMIHLPVGEPHFSAKATLLVELDHHCPYCGTVSPATVVGKGHGSTGGAFLDNGRQEARDLARDSSQRDAALLIRMATCPRCHRRDEGEIRALVKRTALPLVGLTLVMGGMSYWNNHEHPYNGFL